MDEPLFIAGIIFFFLLGFAGQFERMYKIERGKQIERAQRDQYYIGLYNTNRPRLRYPPYPVRRSKTGLGPH